MLGYVTANQEKLTPKERQTYRSYYCGLCRELNDRYHYAGRMTLNYDMTFLYLLLTGLYEPVPVNRQSRCIPHPLRPHTEISNPLVSYCADMNILLAYYDLLDDWDDEKKLSGCLGSGLLKKGCGMVRQRYPRQAKAVLHGVAALRQCELREAKEIDAASGISGRMLGEILVFQEDEWAETLRCMGFYLGKFIYLCDAYEDLEKDVRAGRYNPWKCDWKDRPDFEDFSAGILENVMGECARTFERLPILTHAEILRNILYSGIWTRYELTRRKRHRREKNSKNRRRATLRASGFTHHDE